MNVAMITHDGPYVCGGDLVIVDADGTSTTTHQAALCRCGGSGNKPFCDGSHNRLRFSDPGMLPSDATPGRAGAGRVTITAQRNGSLKVDGPFTLTGSDGRTSTGDSQFLCRCGGSASKPYCDGSHRRNGFAG